MQQKPNSKASKDKNKFKPLFTCVVAGQQQQAQPGQGAYPDQRNQLQTSLSGGLADQSEQSQKQNIPSRPSLGSKKQKSNNQASGRQAVSGAKNNTITIDLDTALKQRGGLIDGQTSQKDGPISSKRHFQEAQLEQSGAGTKKKTKRTVAGQIAAATPVGGDNSAGAGMGGKLFIRPNHVNFSSRVDEDHAKTSKHNRRQLSSQGTGQIEQKSRYGTVVPMSPPANTNFASLSRKTRAPRKQSKEIDKESLKQQMLATPNTIKNSNNLSAYQTQSQPVKSAKMIQDVAKSSNDDNKVLGSDKMSSPGPNGKVDMLSKRIIDLTTEVRKDKVHKWNTRLQDNKNNTRSFNKEVRNRRNMKALQSLNSPQQNGSDWFSVGTNQQLDVEQKSLGAQNESSVALNNQQLLKLLDENRNSIEGPSQIMENGEGEEASYRDGFGGTSWNSNLISNEIKHQPILRLISPTACDITGRNIDDLPQLDSRQLSEGEENVLATQRYTESSQQEERVRHHIFNQTSDQAAVMGMLDCEDQPAVPYSERRTYNNPTTQNVSPLQDPSHISSCQVSVSERNSRQMQASLSRIIANASQSENLTDDAENTYRYHQNVRGSKSNNRIEDYEAQSNQRRALSGLGSVGNLTGIGYKGELGRSYTRLKQELNQHPQQSSSQKKVIGKALTINRKESKRHQDLLRMKSPKPGKSWSEVMSCKETRNVSLRVDKPHESTRNSHVLKMSSLLGSKNDLSGRNAQNENGYQDDERKKLVNAYYQKAELAKQSIHRPKVGGQGAQIKGLLANSHHLNDSQLVNFKASPNNTLDDTQQQNVCINSFQSVVAEKQRTALLEQRDALKDLDSSKNMVKTQKNINFKSIFKMNNLHGSYSTQQQPDHHSEQNQNTSLARVPQSNTQDFKRLRDGQGPSGSGRIYSKLSDSKNGLQMVKDNLNNSAFVSNDRNFSKRNSINQVKEMSLGRATGSQTRQGAGIDTKNQNMGKKRYQMDQKSTQTQLVIIKKDLKFITVNMLNMNLQTVDFQDNKLVSLPNEICQLSQLQKLKLDRNHLSKLPGNIGLLRKLEVLNLTKNELTEIPPSLQHCKSLQELYISDNKIEQLSPNLFNYMSQLEILHMHSNLIYQIPSSMANLTKLNSLSLEWFIYLDPPQQITQSGQAGATVINELKTFCLRQITVKDIKEKKQSDQRTFLEFMVQFYLCAPLKKQEVTKQQIIEGINQLRFTGKQRCLAQTTCSHKHHYLFQEVINSKSNSTISKLINENYDLNVTDTQEQAPLLGSLRQQSIEYPKILLSSPNLRCLNMNQQSLKHGYPLHMAILSHKFEIALQMLKLKDQIDPNVLNSVGANVAHLLFVKYDKDSVTAFKILKQCIEVGVDLNLIDRMAAAPIHLALGKKQHQALKDMAQLNKERGRRVFDFNIRDKRGQTPLHYAVEKQDHDMFLALIRDEWVDPHAFDTEEFQKARRCSVIFSAFHHILYNREKLAMRRLNFSDRCLLKIAAMRELLGTEGCAVSSSYTLAWKRGSQSSQVDNQSYQSRQFESIKKNKDRDVSKTKEEENFRSINQIRSNDDTIGKDRWPQWQIRHPNSLWKDVPNQQMIDDICTFQENANINVTHSMFNLRAKRKMEREQALQQAKALEEAQQIQLEQQTNIGRHSIAQENPYDIRGRAANVMDPNIKGGQIRSLSRISHLSYKSDANAFKKIHNQSASKSSNANTQKMKYSRKLDNEMYHSGNHYFKSEARRQMIMQDDDVVDLPVKSHQRQKSTVQVSSKQQALDDRTGGELVYMKDGFIQSKSNILRMASQVGNKSGASLQQSSFLSEQHQQQIRMRKMLSRKQKSSSFDCDLQSQINNEYNSGEMLNVERMSRLQEAGNKIEYIFHNNNHSINNTNQQLDVEFVDKEYLYQQRQQSKEQKWQNGSMQTLMKKARNELKNQNISQQRGSKSSQKDTNNKKGQLSFMSPSNYQKSMLQERKIGDALPREQIKNHSFNTKQQASRPKTSFIDSYYNLSNSKMSSQTPMDMKKSTGMKVQPKIFGPKPEGATQAKSLRKGGVSRRGNHQPVGQNIDDIDVQIEGLGDKKEKQKSDNDDSDGGQKGTKSTKNNNKNNNTKDKNYDSGRIYISNLNINFNNVFINVKDVSIPSTPSSRAATRNDNNYATEPMDFSNVTNKGASTTGGQIHKNIPSIRNIFAQDNTEKQNKDLRSDIEMLVKSNVQSLRGGSTGGRPSKQSLDGSGVENGTKSGDHPRDKNSTRNRASMQKMKKIIQK